MAETEPVRDECKICDIVLVAVGLAVAGVLAFMAIDLATDGKLSAGFSRGLAPVVGTIAPGETDEHDAG